MAVKKYSLKRDGNIRLSENFRLKEFQCHDGSDKILHDDRLCPVLEKLFFIKIPGKKIRAINVNSGYRTPEWSCRPEVGGYATDPHTRGIAADIKIALEGGGYVPANLICEYLEDIGFIGGVGKINEYSVHIDVREKKCWFDETHGSRIVNSWYAYFGDKMPEKVQSVKTDKPAGAKFGIDISHYENDSGKVDLAAAKAAGVEFVIVKAGYGRYAGQVDPGFEKNYSAAKAAGLPVGAYWYSYATTVDQAKAEAKQCLDAIKGKQFEFPIYYDFEESKQFEAGKANVSAMIDAFLATVQAAGYFVGLYMSRSYIEQYVSSDVQKKYTMWVAEYGSKCKYAGQTDIWQYGSGQISGIAKKNVDLDYCYREFPAEIKKAGLNGFALAPGDVNGDGKVNSSDARTVLRAAAKLEDLTDAQEKAADVDGDGRVTSADAREILKKAAKKE
ncbi:MAG: hypothetical protein IJK23_12310 [Clostridia bacterium]|nr:hypothetical protein [Clostridia bacterium]